MSASQEAGMNSDFERLEYIAESFVANHPDFLALHEESRRLIAPRLVAMMRKVEGYLADAPQDPAAYEQVGMYLAKSREETTVSDSMPMRILAVIGVKAPKMTDFECVLTTDEAWERHLARIDASAAA